MTRYVVERLLLTVPVLFGVTIVSFLVLHLTPGDAVTSMLGTEAFDPQVAEALRHQLGLDRPLYEQYFAWLGKLLVGDIGRSVRTNQPVAELIAQAVPVTLQLTAAALALSIAVGVPLGIIAANSKGSVIDRAISVFGAAGLSMPSFWVAILLIYIFGLKLRLLPPVGYTPLSVDVAASLAATVLPAICIGLRSATTIARILRASLIDVLGEDFIRTATAKGLHPSAVLRIHALRNALTPLVTIVGIQVATLLSGTIIIETIFAWPGLGKLAADAIFARDLPVIQGAVLVAAIGVLAANSIVDILYATLDPRIRVT